MQEMFICMQVLVGRHIYRYGNDNKPISDAPPRTWSCEGAFLCIEAGFDGIHDEKR
jgi:hypothetical protein